MDAFPIIISVCSSIASGLVVYLIKNSNQRIRYLEEKFISKEEARQLVEDKTSGIHSDLQYVKNKIDQLFQLYIENKLK